jgi:tRNA threonylcarbamoyladenosine biosynthesis protein TsaE
MATHISHSPEETAALARALAPTLEKGSVLALVGDLGAGKTQFVKGLAEGLGVLSAVTSPTYTLIHEYPAPPGSPPLFHIDLYRLETAEEALAIGLDDYLEGTGITAIEWPDKFPHLLPERTLWVHFQIGEGDTREIVF